MRMSPQKTRATQVKSRRGARKQDANEKTGGEGKNGVLAWRNADA